MVMCCFKFRDIGAFVGIAAWGGNGAAFALAVVECSVDDGSVDVAFDEFDYHFLTDARDELYTHFGEASPNELVDIVISDADGAAAKNGLALCAFFGLTYEH